MSSDISFGHGYLFSLELLSGFFDLPIDVAGALKQNRITGLRELGETGWDKFFFGDEFGGRMVLFVGFINDEAAGNAFYRLFSCWVNLCDEQMVGERKRSAEFLRQVRGARIAVRLEDDDELALDRGPERFESGLGLGRVMAVIVPQHDSPDAAS